MTQEEGSQRDVTRAALRLLGGDGFVLAGSGAIREHGLVDRPTRDVDLFTDVTDPDRFAVAVDRLVSGLGEAGYEVEVVRRAPQFAQLRVATVRGEVVDVDLGVDWRAEPAAVLSVGPVLSEADAVGNKVSALYSRAAARDYLDVDAIRASGRFSDADLVTAAGERDAGFEVAMFATQLEQVRHLSLSRVARYGMGAEQLLAMQDRFRSWADELRAAEGPSLADLIARSRGAQRSAPGPSRAFDPPLPAPEPPGRDVGQGHEL